MVLLMGSCLAMSGQTLPNTPGVSTTLQPQPNSNNTPDDSWKGGNENQRDPSIMIYCVISMEEGIQTDVPLFGLTGYAIWVKD